ncbi:MAG: DNA adenine methylase [Prolixibacteraceae bacterium]|nr:DNA adenine methylase [Prolixibacteraceae bacterium]
MFIGEKMLFSEYKYFQHSFPEPQYLGAKHTLISWLNKHIPRDVKTALDAFGGSQSVAFFLKQRGFTTTTNDFLNFNHQIGMALIENKDQILTDEDIHLLLNIDANSDPDFQLMEDTYTDIFFERSESRFLDGFRKNIEHLKNPYKKALAFTIMSRSLTRKITMGHFAHTQALKYASCPERLKRNRSLARPIKDIFVELVPKYNQAVFDNQKENKSHNENILDLLPKMGPVDLAYFDPPYCDSHADYQSFYHLLETYVEYWKDKQFINTIKRYEPQKFSGFDKKRDVVASFEKLFESAQDIPYWLISYNNRSYPSVDDFQKLVAKYRDVEVEYKAYENGRGGKGSVAGSCEILLVCKKRLVVSIPFECERELAYA